MDNKTLLVTGSSGLIGSEVCEYFARQGWRVHGVDNNMRAGFFGPQGDTRWNQQRLQESVPGFVHHELDIRDRQAVLQLFEELRPAAVVHAAAQPSHDLAATMPFEDFDTNAMGTLNLLESTRRFAGEAPFVLLSTNKVYGDVPNELPLVELEKRFDYADGREGIGEDTRIDQCLHSLFGASKVAADVLTQEYGRYFNMATCCLRGGCLTGPNHSGVTLHGFLSYLIKCNVSGTEYKIIGYKGKQVRDNIHSSDVAKFIECFFNNPKSGEVYNIGGGRGNSCSILEALELVEALSGKKSLVTYVDAERKGDHICYISDLSKAKADFPQWSLSKNLNQIFEEIFCRWQKSAADCVV